MTMPVPMESTSEHPPETLSGLVVSLAFWLGLLVSASLFAIVGLAPKYLTYLQLRNQFDSNQLKLVHYEQQADQIEKVIDAIRRDKDFAAELARVEFDAVSPGEEVIPVDVGLELDARHVVTPPDTDVIPMWYEPAVRMFASDGSLRLTLLSMAALLVVMVFAFLQPAGSEQPGVASDNLSLWQIVRRRYIRER